MIITNDKTWFDRWWNPLSDAANILTPLEASTKWGACRCVVGTDPTNCGLSYSPDLFDESVADETRDKIFAVMALMPNVAFQVVTDYPERARIYLGDVEREVLIGCAAGCFLDGDWIWKKGKGWRNRIEDLISISHGFDPKASRHNQERLASTALLPTKNVWFGTRVRNQTEADARVPELLMIDGPVLFLLCEPLTGPVDLGQQIFGTCSSCEGQGNYGRGDDVRDCSRCEGDMCGEDNNGISHIIAGGATGKDAYPSHPDWFRDIRDLCNSKFIPFFFNGWGEWVCSEGRDAEGDIQFRSDGVITGKVTSVRYATNPTVKAGRQAVARNAGDNGFGVTMDENPIGVTTQITVDHNERLGRYTLMRRVGADKSGRILDGQEWNGFPTPQEAKR